MMNNLYRLVSILVISITCSLYATTSLAVDYGTGGSHGVNCTGDVCQCTQQFCGCGESSYCDSISGVCLGNTAVNTNCNYKQRQCFGKENGVQKSCKQYCNC